MCINSVKETCFSQKYQKWMCLILELNSSIMFALLLLSSSSSIYQKFDLFYLATKKTSCL